MSPFSSGRERTLWILTGIVVLGVFSTLGLARTLADELQRRGLFDALFGIAAVLVLVAIIVSGLSTRPRGVEAAAALGIVAVYLLIFTRMAIPEERTHLLEYGVVALLIHAALAERSRNQRGVTAPGLVAVGVASMIGVVDELIQLVLPDRVFDVRDIAFNILAAAMAIGASRALAWVRSRGVTG